VHAFPNILVDNILPIPVSSINQIVFDLHWTYGVGNTPAGFTSSSDLTANSVNTNVAVDMFFDSDPKAAQNSTQAMYEVMVWFAQIGDSSKPYGDKTSTSRKLDGTTFNLWSGKKSDTITGEKYVLTWVASEITGRFTGDIYPLITDLYNLSGDIYPSSTDYLGILSFGTETYSAARNVTFWASTLSIDIQK
jgi:Glycosyl hydrolase family 12.